MTARHVAITKCLFLFALVASVVIVPGVSAQGNPPAPVNIIAAQTGSPGEVRISWDEVPDAAYYRIGWVVMDDYRAQVAAGGNWLETFTFADVPNRGQTTHTVSRLTPGLRHAFIVGSNDERHGTLAWPPASGWHYLTLEDAPDGDPPLGSTTLEVSWDAIPDAEFYRIGWAVHEDYLAIVEEGGDWLEAFTFVDVANSGQTTHTISRLTEGVRYAVVVAPNDSRYGTPQWPPQTALQLAPPGEDVAPPDTVEASPPVMMELPAGEAITLTQESGAQIDVPAGATSVDTTVSITEVEPPESDVNVARVFDFSVGDAELFEPVTLTIPFDLEEGEDPSSVRAVHWDEEAMEWFVVPGRVDAAAGVVVVTAPQLSLFGYIADYLTENVGLQGYAVLNSCDATEPDQGDFTVKTFQVTLKADVEDNGFAQWWGLRHPPLYVVFVLEDPRRGLNLEVPTDRQKVPTNEMASFSFELGPSSDPVVGWPEEQKEALATQHEDRAGQLSLLPIKWFPGEIDLTCRLEAGDFNPLDTNDVLDMVVDGTGITVSQYEPNSDYGRLTRCDLAPDLQEPLVQGEALGLEVSGHTTRFYGGVEYWLYQDGERIAHGGRSRQRTGLNAVVASTVGPQSLNIPEAGVYTVTLDCALWGHMISDAYAPQDNYVAYAEAKGIRENQKAFNELLEKGKALADHLDDVVNGGSSGVSLDDIFTNIFRAIGNVFKAIINQVYRELEKELLGQFKSVYRGFGANCDDEAYQELDTVEKQFVQNVERDICDYALLGAATTTIDLEVVPARWAHLEIEPAGHLPGEGGDRDVTVRVYTHESNTAGHQRTPPMITAPLPSRLVPTGARIHWPAPPVQRCGETERQGYDEVCWEAVFEDVPDNTVRAVANAKGEITARNDAEITITVRSARAIGGKVPSGSITVSGLSPYATDRAVLMALYNATRGDFWSDNHLWGSEDDIQYWHGVNEWLGLTNSEMAANSAVSLILSRNRLKGELPGALGYLPNLRYLHLSANEDLEGEIPATLGELASLEYLELLDNDLEGEIPAALGKLTNLRQLDLSGNDLRGEIPVRLDILAEEVDLGSLSNLESLDLSDNRLRGEIPPGLGRLSNLESLDLSDNRLAGEIPAELGNLVNLEDLYLSGNDDLAGCLPANFRHLHNDDLDDVDLPFCDVALSGLTVSSGELEPAFAPHVTKYEADTTDARVVIFPTSDPHADLRFLRNGRTLAKATAAQGAAGVPVDLECGENDVDIRVTSEDGRETYTIVFTREGGIPPEAPVVTRVNGIPGGLRVSLILADSNCAGIVTQYNLRYSTDGANWMVIEKHFGTTQYTISDLTPGTTYHVQVQAVSKYGSSPWSETRLGTPQVKTATRRSGPSISADYTVYEDVGTLEIPVTISQPPAEASTVRVWTFGLTAEHPHDFERINTLITFDPQSPDFSLTQTVSIPIYDDPHAEPTQYFQVGFDIDSGEQPPGLDLDTLMVAILDNDTATVGFIQTRYEVESRFEAEALVGVMVDNPTSSCGIETDLDDPVYAHVSYYDPLGAVASPPTSSVELNIGECTLRRVFPVGVNDVAQETEVMFRLERVTYPGLGQDIRSVAIDEASMTTTLVIKPWVRFVFGFEENGYEVDEGDAVTICVERITPADFTMEVEVSYSDADGAIASGIPSSLTFDADDSSECFTAQTNNVAAEATVEMSIDPVDGRAVASPSTVTLTVRDTN